MEPPKDEKKKQQIIASAGPKRWDSWEFFIYAVIFAVCVPMMIKAVVDVSSQSNINYPKYEHLLSQGWLFGRKVDNSDLQFQSVRNNFPYLFLVVGIHYLLRQAANALNIGRLKFDLAFALLFLAGLHGISVVKILLILAVNYRISRIHNRQLAYLSTWIYGIAILFANELLIGYPLGSLHPDLAWLDSFGGMMPRWEVLFKFTMIRMISYSIDYLDAVQVTKQKPAIKPKFEIEDERQRLNTPHAVSEYSFANFLAYTTYSPLYLAGPILTYNDYLYQSKTPLPSVTLNRVIPYAIRFFFCLIIMEVLLHYTYVVAISKTRAWDGDTPFQISMIALFNLNIIWLKLLLPWRLFRLWALIDKIDAPENMIRCVNNNYSGLSFWRSWHRSYNRWVLRYIYIPLGGSNRPIINTLLVFTFVAIWHDIQLHLLFWGWLVVLFIMPEVLMSLVLPAKKYGQYAWYRHACAVGAVANIWMMMIANLVGFCVGLDGIQQMLSDMIYTADGIKYVVLSSMALFVGVQAMFEFREREKRMGINMRC